MTYLVVSIFWYKLLLLTDANFDFDSIGLGIQGSTRTRKVERD